MLEEFYRVLGQRGELGPMLYEARKLKNYGPVVVNDDRLR